MATGATALTLRGLVPVYRAGAENTCPACAKSNWIVGRTTAECGFCGTALTIATPFWTTVRLRAA